MKLVIDIESNNLLNKALDYSNLPYRLKPEFKIWCVVVTNKDTKESVSFYKESLTKDNLRKALKGCTELIGHNIIGYDLPILYLYGLLDYNVGYPEQSSTVFGTDTLITDTLLWSKLLEPDRFLGHSLKAWGKRLGNAKTEFDDWSQFSQEQLDYCIQDTKVNCDVYDALVLEKATADWDRAYRMEAKLADLTLKQELLGFDFNMDLAKKTLEELDSLMLVTANKVNPILPPKKLTKGKIQEFTMPKLRFKKDGTLSSVFQKWLNKHGAKFVLDSLDNNDYLLYKGKKFYIKDELPLETTEVATVDDVDVVKGYLLNLGWVPSEIKERNLTVNTDKTKRDYKAIIKAIDAYVEQTKDSVFMKLRLEALNTDLRSLRQFLINKIDGSKPIYVPTTPMLRVGVEKELCPNLIRLGDKAEVAGIVAEYYTYRHRRNSIAGGTLDEDGEPITGYMSQVREDGRIATPADTLGANTGRYKHKGVCNVPRTTSLFGEKMRSLFGSGRGLHQLGYDFASLEARIMGHYVLPYDGDELANALLASKPRDIHSINALKLGIDRGSAKSFSYACIYGAQPKKLAKMLGITESKAKELFNAYWEAVLPLKQLKLQLEKAWEARGKKFIKGIDGRLLHTRSKHSLINVLFQSGGAISVKWSLVRLAQYLEELNMLGNPFEHAKQDMKVWFLIAYHDEAQLALNPKLIDVKLYGTEEEAKANLAEGSSAIGHSSKGYYVAYKTQVVECIEKSIQKAQEELKLRVELGFEWIVGRNWGQCH